MENNFNLICYDFNEKLIALINEYGEKIPAYVMHMLVKDVLMKVTQEKDKIILDLLCEREATSKKTETVEIPIHTIEESMAE